MDNGSGVWKFLVTLAFFGAILGFWFNEASNFADDREIDLAHRSILPVACTLGASRIAEMDQTAQAYFWQSNVRLDIQIKKEEQKSEIHQLVKPTGVAYFWSDASAFGNTRTQAVTFEDLAGGPATNAWLCYPWIFLDLGKFELPKEVQFQ